jgi:hypothetical protein
MNLMIYYLHWHEYSNSQAQEIHPTRAIAHPPLGKQGIFILGGKKEKKSDLLLIKLQKYHYFLSFKIC